MQIVQFPLKLFGVNTYIIWDPRTLDAAIIDSAMVDDEDRRKIDNFIAANHLHLTHAIYTHGHIDHIAGQSYIAKKYGLQASGNEADNFLMQRARQQAQMFGMSEDIAADMSICHCLKHGDRIKIGEEELEVLQVPGHSPGSIALYDKEDGWIITGDALFDGSIGRTDLPGGNYGQLISSIKDRLFILPPDTIVYPGHGASTTIGREICSNPFFMARN